MAAHRRLLTHRHPVPGLPLGYQAFVPPRAEHPPPLIAVHGNGRHARRQFNAFLPHALALGIPVIAPRFDRERFAGYQSLRGADGPLVAQESLRLMLADARDVLGIDTTVVDLVGYSGGAQFVHRYALASCDGVRRVVVAAAGWYTYLTHTRPFPTGLGASTSTGGRALDPEPFLRLPVHVLVGAHDVKRDRSLRMGTSLDRRQGPDRLTRALRWVDHVEEEACRRGIPSRITFDLLPDSGHGFGEAVRAGGLVDRALAFLHSPPDQPHTHYFPHGSIQ